MENQKAPDEEFAVLVVNLPRWVHRGFKEVCAARGVTMTAMIQQFTKDVLLAHGVEKDNRSGNAGTEQ